MCMKHSLSGSGFEVKESILLYIILHLDLSGLGGSHVGCLNYPFVIIRQSIIFRLFIRSHSYSVGFVITIQSGLRTTWDIIKCCL